MKINSTHKTILAVTMLTGILLIAGCSKEKSQQTSGPSTTNSSPYYLTGLLGGEAITISGSSNPSVDSVTIYIDSNGHQCGSGGGQQIYQHTQYISGATWVNANNTGSANTTSSVQANIQLKKLSVRVYVAPISTSTSGTLYNLLAPGETALSTPNDPNDGVIVSIRDKAGVLWTSLGEQSGSTFSINSTGSNMGSYAIISGTINAKMYDSNGNVKQLTSTAFNAMVGL